MAYPRLIVSPSAAKRIPHHDCWVFRDELVNPPSSLESGAVVELTDDHHTRLAVAFYSARSHIAARVISGERARMVDRDLFSSRLRSAIARRAAIEGTNAKRLVFGEADGLPGLIVDQYADVVVLQIRIPGLEPWRPVLVELLQEQLHPAGILERSDKEFREEEGLPPVVQVLSGRVPERVEIQEDGLRFLVEPQHGHKTGFYLDQRETRRAVRELIQPGDRVADVFAYTGAFGIGAASRGAAVTCVEQNERFLALAKEHASLNGVVPQLSFVSGDAFYWLEAKAKSSERFDWVLLDPPSLAKSKTEMLKGRQALHRLLVHALELLSPRGTLVLSVCTYHLLELTEEILRIAAAERGLRLAITGRSMQAPDHPWVLQMPMTRYLMTWMARRDALSPG